jgi:hypothetical protein
MVPSCPLTMEAGCDVARDEGALGSLDVLRDVESLSVTKWTRRRTSVHSASVCSP